MSPPLCAFFSFYTLAGHLSRMVLPYVNRIAGTGMKATAMKPNMLLPHPKPRVLYIDGPARGSRAPNKHRSTVIPAIAEAAYCGKLSIR
jgi:hypothetical protein